MSSVKENSLENVNNTKNLNLNHGNESNSENTAIENIKTTKTNIKNKRKSSPNQKHFDLIEQLDYGDEDDENNLSVQNTTKLQNKLLSPVEIRRSKRINKSEIKSYNEDNYNEDNLNENNLNENNLNENNYDSDSHSDSSIKQHNQDFSNDLENSSNQFIVPNNVQLFNSLPSATNDALKTFSPIENCIYLNKSLGNSGQDESMTCECNELYDDSLKINLSCGENSDCINRLTSMECINNECNCGDNCQNQRFQRKEYAKVDVIQTEKKGYGLRTIENLMIDSFIYEYIGEVVDQSRFRKRMINYDQEGRKHFYFMMLQNGEFIDATIKGTLARFVNHSCNPNCYVDKWVVGSKLRMGIFAKRNILAGEELTFDYNVDRYGADPQPCYCGDKNCLGFIGGKTQTDVQLKLPQMFLDALGIETDDEETWDILTPKNIFNNKKKKLNNNNNNNNINDLLSEQPSLIKTTKVKSSNVSKVMSALLQCKEKWLIQKIIDRLKISDDPIVQSRVMKMHGYQILGTVLRNWKHDVNIINSVLEVLSKWPKFTRNKISSSKIENTVKELANNENENQSTRLLANNLLSDWSNLEMAYRIPRRDRTINKLEGDTNGHTRLNQLKEEYDDDDDDESISQSKSDSILKDNNSDNDMKAKREERQKEYERARKDHMWRNRKTGMATRLPHGWESSQDAHGRIYYYNKQTSVTQWDFPVDAKNNDNSRAYLGKYSNNSYQRNNRASKNYTDTILEMEKQKEKEKVAKALNEKMRLQKIIDNVSKMPDPVIPEAEKKKNNINNKVAIYDDTYNDDSYDILNDRHRQRHHHRSRSKNHHREHTDSSKHSKHDKTHKSSEHSVNDHSHSSTSYPDKSSQEVDIEKSLKKAFAKYVTSLLSAYKDKLSREDIKHSAKEIVEILVGKEMKKGNNNGKNPKKIVEERKHKIKNFSLTFMDKVVIKKKAKAKGEKTKGNDGIKTKEEDEGENEDDSVNRDLSYSPEYNSAETLGTISSLSTNGSENAKKTERRPLVHEDDIDSINDNEAKRRRINLENKEDNA